jgi:hypothetical protein
MHLKLKAIKTQQLVRLSDVYLSHGTQEALEEDCEFKASLGYVASSGQSGLHHETLSQMND